MLARVVIATAGDPRNVPLPRPWGYVAGPLGLVGPGVRSGLRGIDAEMGTIGRPPCVAELVPGKMEFNASIYFLPSELYLRWLVVICFFILWSVTEEINTW
jgi:hypothetical protein